MGTQLVGLDKDTHKELLLKHMRKKGENGTPFKELEQVLPSHSRNQIKVLMRELQQAGLIYAVGKTSSARWFAR
jgi:ATP-dependent DNA helicase RecG